MTRSDRASRHRAIARAMRSPAFLRSGDLHRSVLAHHYTMAFTLIQATGDTESTDQLREPAASALAQAADRAMAIDCERACQQYRTGLDILPAGSPLRGHVLAKLGIALTLTGEPVDAARMLESAIEELNEQNERESAAAAIVDLSRALLDAGDPRAHAVAREGRRRPRRRTPFAPSSSQCWRVGRPQPSSSETWGDSLAASGGALDRCGSPGGPHAGQGPRMSRLGALRDRTHRRGCGGRTPAARSLEGQDKRPNADKPVWQHRKLLALYGSVMEARAVGE